MLLTEYDYDTDIAVQREESLKIGIKQGFAQGISQGISQGLYQNKLETAKLMKGMNYPIDDICTISGLSQEEIENL